MDRKEAIEYLNRKGKIKSDKHDLDVITEKEAIAQDEEKIEQVMKEGKIYGDPKAEVEF